MKRAVGLGLVLAIMAVAGEHLRAKSARARPAESPLATHEGCRGTPFPQKPQDVTSQMSEVAAGVKVVQLTSGDTHYITYHDLPAYSPATGLLVMNNQSRGVLTMRPDGSDAQLISGITMLPSRLSDDGRFVIFVAAGAAPSKPNLYGIWLDKPGPCSKVTLTALPMQAMGRSPNVSQPVSYGKRKEVIAIAVGASLRRLLSDGIYLDPEPGIDPPDLYHGHSFHVLRVNPKFPQWIWYARNLKPEGSWGAPEVWLYNFETKQVCSATPIGKARGHVVWSPDGTKIAMSAGGPGNLEVATVLDSSGKPAGNCSDGKFGGFDTKIIAERIVAHAAPAHLAADYCVWPPDNSPVFACLSSKISGRKIFLVAADGHGVKFLTNTDTHHGSDPGTPVLVFAQDSQHILFRSDRDGAPQVYMVSGFTPSVP